MGKGQLESLELACTLLYLKWITNKDLLYSTGNSAQCYVATWMGGGVGGEWIHMCVGLSPFSWNYYDIVNWLYTPIQNKKLKKKQEGREEMKATYFWKLENRWMKSDRLSRSQREETKLVREKADKHPHWHNRIFQEMTALGSSETESEGGPVSWRIGWKLTRQFSLWIPFQTEAKGRVTLPTLE